MLQITLSLCSYCFHLHFDPHHMNHWKKSPKWFFSSKLFFFQAVLHWTVQVILLRHKLNSFFSSLKSMGHFIIKFRLYTLFIISMNSAFSSFLHLLPQCFLLPLNLNLEPFLNMCNLFTNGKYNMLPFPLLSFIPFLPAWAPLPL